MKPMPCRPQCVWQRLRQGKRATLVCRPHPGNPHVPIDQEHSEERRKQRCRPEENTERNFEVAVDQNGRLPRSLPGCPERLGLMCSPPSRHPFEPYPYDQKCRSEEHTSEP